MPATYTKEQRVAALSALRANAGCIRQTARQLNIPASTLRKWRDEGQDIIDTSTLASLMREVAVKILGHMQDEQKLAKTPIQALAIAFGIVMDKLELLEGTRQDDGQILQLLSALQEARQ